MINVLGDGAFDARDIFLYLDEPYVLFNQGPKKHIPNAKECYTRKIIVISQMADYERWSATIVYGYSWIVESVFSAIKRIVWRCHL